MPIIRNQNDWKLIFGTDIHLLTSLISNTFYCSFLSTILRVLYVSAFIFWYFILPLHNIQLIHLATSYFKDSDYLTLHLSQTAHFQVILFYLQSKRKITDADNWGLGPDSMADSVPLVCRLVEQRQTQSQALIAQIDEQTWLVNQALATEYKLNKQKSPV